MAAEGVSQEKSDGNFELYIDNWDHNHHHHRADNAASQWNVRGTSWSGTDGIKAISKL